MRYLQNAGVVVTAWMAAIILLPSTAEAVAGGSFANPREAPWAVHIRSYPSADDKRHVVCSGAIVGRGLVMTAAHCLQQNSECGSPRSTYPLVTLQFSNRRGLKINNPGRNNRLRRHPDFHLCATGPPIATQWAPVNDVGFIRFRTKVGLRRLRLASPSAINRFEGEGVTLFAAGQYHPTGQDWAYPDWIRKSHDGGFFMNPSRTCGYRTALCFRSKLSALEPGDSGGPFVGWIGGWKLLGTASGYEGDTPGTYRTVNFAASLADHGIRRWVDKQIAAGYP